jgi:hypothetical protein
MCRRARCFGTEPVEGEGGEGVIVTGELFGQIGQDGVLPDEMNPFLAQVRAQEVARPNGCAAVGEEAVRFVDRVGEPGECRLVARQPAA